MHGLKEPLEGPNKETSNAELGHRHMRRGQLEEMHCSALHIIERLHIGASSSHITLLYRRTRAEWVRVLE